MMQPSSSPCHAPTSRHQPATSFSTGSDSPIAVPSAPGISLAVERVAARTVRDQGLGSGGPTWSATAVRALSISACCAPDGPAVTLRSSSQSLPSRTLRAGSWPVTRSASQPIGQPT